MPELPEVESIVRRLRDGCAEHPSLSGMRFQQANILWAGSVASPSPEQFCRRIIGQEIQQISRRGKYLLLSLSQDTLLIHLRMSGDLFVLPLQQSLPAHSRVVFTLDHPFNFVFNDSRKFGRLWLVADPQEVLSGLGQEPLDLAFTADDFYEALRGKKRQLKPLLLDQSFLAGIGNIYADEALHLAGLHPLTPADHLSPSQAKKLLEAIRYVLREGIRRNGASIDWVYRGGEFQNHFRVYQRTGEPCPFCGSPIQRITVGQRGTHFCPQCQPLPS